MQIAKYSHVGDKLAYSISPVFLAEIKFCKKYFWASYEVGACCLCTVSSAAQLCLLHLFGSNEATEVWSFLKNGKNVQFSMSAKKAILGLRWARAVCALSRPNLDSVCCCCCCSGLGLGMLGLRMRRTHQKSQVDPATQFGRGTPPGHNTILRLGSLEKKSIFLWFLGNLIESGGSEN